MKLAARSDFSEPSRSFTCAVGRPRRPCRVSSTATRSPSFASAVAPGGIVSSRPSCFLSIGSSRPPPFGSRRNTPSWRCRERSRILMTRPVWRIGPSSAISSVRSSARSPTPGISFERALRGTCMRMRGASPCSSVSHSVGTAISSPSRSRSVISESTTEGRVPAWCSFLRRFSTVPSSLRSRSM